MQLRREVFVWCPSQDIMVGSMYQAKIPPHSPCANQESGKMQPTDGRCDCWRASCRVPPQLHLSLWASCSVQQWGPVAVEAGASAGGRRQGLFVECTETLLPWGGSIWSNTRRHCPRQWTGTGPLRHMSRGSPTSRNFRNQVHGILHVHSRCGKSREFLYFAESEYQGILFLF